MSQLLLQTPLSDRHLKAVNRASHLDGAAGTVFKPDEVIGDG